MPKWLFMLVLLLIAGSVHAQDGDLAAGTLTFESLTRAYFIHVPDDLETPAPLVIALHPRFGDGESMAAYTDFNTIADREGFIVAYPNAVSGEWNFVRDIPGYSTAHDDTAFLNALVDHLAADHAIDMTRVYLAGFSNGGFMAERVACEDPARFAAFATVAAAGFGGMFEVCMEPGDFTAPMLLMHGTADRNIPWEGTPVRREGQTIYITYPVGETLGYWAAVNGCSPDAETTDVPQLGMSPGTSVRVVALDCPENAQVVVYGIVGGGHAWPRTDQIDLPEQGAVNRDIDAAAEIWKFFEQHSRP